MKIVVATDSFKGTLSSEQAGNCIIRGFQKVFPHYSYSLIPVADGGEGLCLSLTKAMNGEIITINAHDALYRPINTQIGLIKKQSTAIIEMASTVGLTMLTQEEQNPMQTNSYGFGEAIATAIQLGMTNIILGIGGTATIDAGIGMLMALQLQFFNQKKVFSDLTSNPLLHIDDFKTTKDFKNFEEISFNIACDVQNTLYGKEGAAYVYGKQKGANKNEIALLDKKLKSFAQLLYLKTNKDISTIQGGGAGGGVPASLSAIYNSKLQSGAELMLEKIGFEDIISDADLIITGEGCSDSQTLQGKLPLAILKAGGKKHKKVCLLSGQNTNKELFFKAGFDVVESVQSLINTNKNYLDPMIAKRNLIDAATIMGKKIIHEIK